MCALEQAAMDKGSWDLAWLMLFMEDPPAQVFGRHPPMSTQRAFSALARQHWATTNMAYFRELDTLATRREEIRRQSGQWALRWKNKWKGDRQKEEGGEQDQQEDGGKGKAKGKHKKKGKEDA